MTEVNDSHLGSLENSISDAATEIDEEFQSQYKLKSEKLDYSENKPENVVAGEPEEIKSSGKLDANGKYFESDAGDGTKATDQHLTGIPLILTVISCIGSLFVAALDNTIITTILTDVGNKFHSFEKIGWLTSGYLLPMAALIPSYGKISIAFGRKYVMLVGIFVFMAGSLVSALATSMDMLIGGRVIQGIGGGAITSMVSVILTEAVPINMRPLLFLGIALTWSLASVLGPFIGGSFARVSWRWCFYINLPIGGLAAAMLFISFHPPKPEGNFVEKLKKIDYLGSFLFTSGIILVLLGITFGGGTYPWISVAVLASIILGVLLLAAFGAWNYYYSPHPILLVELTGNFKVMAPLLSGTFNYAFFITLMIYLAAYFQIIHNESPWTSGIHLLPILITVCLSSIFSGVYTKKTRTVKPLLMFSNILGPVGAGLLLLYDVDTGTGKQIGLQIVIGVSIGLQFMTSMISSQIEAPNTVEGSVILVTVLLNFTRSVSAAVGVTVGQLILQSTGTTNIKKLVDSLARDSADYQQLSKIPALTLISSPSTIQTLNPSAKVLVIKELMKSFKDIFYFILALLIISLCFGVFATNKKIPEDVATKIKEAPIDEETGMLEVTPGNPSGHGVLRNVRDEDGFSNAHESRFVTTFDDTLKYEEAQDIQTHEEANDTDFDANDTLRKEKSDLEPPQEVNDTQYENSLKEKTNHEIAHAQVEVHSDDAHTTESNFVFENTHREGSSDTKRDIGKITYEGPSDNDIHNDLKNILYAGDKNTHNGLEDIPSTHTHTVLEEVPKEVLKR